MGWLWGRKGQHSTDRDPFLRLARKVALLEAEIERLETAWAGTKDELRRTMQRIEKANQRAAAREEQPEPEPHLFDGPPEAETAHQKQIRLARAARGA